MPNPFALLDEADAPPGSVKSDKKRKKERKKQKKAEVQLAQATAGQEIGFTPEELTTCVKVLEVIGGNVSFLHSPMLRALRVALHPLVEEQLRKYGAYGADGDTEGSRGKKRKRDLELDEKYINSTQLRQKRMKTLESLCEQEASVPRILDGVAEVDDEELQNMEMPEKTPLLSVPRKCYTCKAPFRELHFFYDQLCPECAALNFLKRDQRADLTGRIALVTGGRVKIGFRAVLKLLRCGATVLVTTRFPKDCAGRFAKEKDFEEWKGRLQIFGLDFRNLAAIEAFCAKLVATLPRLDIIVNNAAQTVRRPPAYFKHLLNTEHTPMEKLPPAVQSVLAASGSFLTYEKDADGEGVPKDALAKGAPAVVAGLSSADASQMHVLATDGIESGKEFFPEDVTDVNGQQVDLRRKTSWTMKLAEIPTPELAEVFAINTIAPTIFNAKLKPLMEKIKDEDKFIVNVSAMEGKFYRYKSDKHPHSNMAKAALNMMTRTSAGDYRQSRIFMTSVDTGWINDENPIHKAAQIAERHKFQTPLDEVDAAARVLDPIIGPLAAREMGQEVEPPYGYFIKDYKKCEW